MDKKDTQDTSATEMVWNIAQKMSAHQGSKRKKSFKVLLAVDAYEYTVEAFECKYNILSFLVTHQLIFSFSAQLH